LEGEEQQEVLEQVRQWNPRTSFPTLVVDESESIVGYKPDQIKEALGL
jgi:glutaredoxin